MISEYEQNLSITEFLYYQECPQKFRIHRILNPIPSYNAFVNSKRSSENYHLREYNQNMISGIELHQFFEDFHKNYSSEITENNPPPEIATNQVKLLYWLNQQKKYYQEGDFWKPLATEASLMTEKQRGIIDCIKISTKNDGIQIIDYKPEPHPNDQITLLFYANLVNEYRKENVEEDSYLYNVAEVGCYYYSQGREKIRKLDAKELNQFKNKLSKIQNNVLAEKFNFNKYYCLNCEYYKTCKIEELRH